MSRLVRARVLALLAVGVALSVGLPARAENPVRPDGRLGQWLVLGPFPNPKLGAPAPPEGVTRAGFQIDYLTSLGGEAAAVLAAGSAVTVGDSTVAPVVVEADAGGRLDFQAVYPEAPLSVAYAYCTVHADRSQDIHLFAGHDDCAKIWLNGQLLHRHWRESGMGLVPRQFHLPARLEAGPNRLLIKVENWGYDWGCLVELFDSTGAAPILQDRQERRALTELQERYPRPRGEWSYVISPGSFPDIVWDEEQTVRDLAGDLPLRVTWYDGDLRAVSSPVDPGRYIAYVEGRTADGRPIRRTVTVYCRRPDWQPWNQSVRAYAAYFAGSGFDSLAFVHHRDIVAPTVGGLVMDGLFRAESGAALAAYWHELEPGVQRQPYETPDLVHNDQQVALKRRILNVSDSTYPPLQPPRRLARPAPTLRTGSAREAGMAADAAAALRQVCQAWYEASGEPFNVLVARHGVVVLHAAFGPCQLDQKFSVASITKSVAGLLYARFLDQGIIGLDDPVGRYLPDFPTEGPAVMTVRQLFTHTTGLEGHGNWGGLNNAWMDNVVVLGLHKLPVGRTHLYNGVGYNLAGKVMEMVSGVSVQRLVQEQLWLPLGIEGSYLSDLGFSAQLNAEDLARMAQLLLNQGRYGDVELFSSATWQQLLPRPLGEFYPEVDVEWGIGLVHRRLEAADAPGQYVLSQELIGHGSATSCIMLADLEHDLVIAQARRTGGQEYDKHYRLLLETVAANVVTDR